MSEIDDVFLKVGSAFAEAHISNIDVDPIVAANINFAIINILIQKWAETLGVSPSMLWSKFASEARPTLELWLAQNREESL